MSTEINCPFCDGEIDADYVLRNDFVVCPHCSKVLVGASPSDAAGDASALAGGKDELEERLLDPSDPVGYLNNFPPEDDCQS